MLFVVYIFYSGVEQNLIITVPLLIDSDYDHFQQFIINASENYDFEY